VEPELCIIRQGDSVPTRNYKTMQNLAAIEIGELKDSLAYAEF